MSIRLTFAMDRLTPFADIQKPATRRAVMTRAMRAVGNLLRADGRAIVQSEARRTGQLQRALGYVVKQYRKATGFAMVFGARRGFKATIRKRGRTYTVDPGKYAHLVELGTRPHSLAAGARTMRTVQRKKKGVRVILAQLGSGKARQHPGAAATRFIHRSVERNRSKIGAAMREEMAKLVRPRKR